MMSWPTLLWVLMASSAAAELAPEQAAIVDRLRGPNLGAQQVEYRATITVPIGDDPPLVIQAAYRIEGLRCTLKITGTSGRAPFLPSPAEGSTYVWAPGSAKLTGVDGVDFPRGPAGPLQVDPGRPPWDFAYLGSYVLAAAAIADPASFTWHSTGEETDEGWQVFEARLAEPLKPGEPHTIAKLRYYFDPARHAIMRIVGCNPDGWKVCETIYSDLKDLPDGSAIPLTSVTTVPAGEARVRMTDRSGDLEGTMHCAGMVTTSHYQWFDVPGVRLPLDREVHDDEGRLLCRFTFHDHRIE